MSRSVAILPVVYGPVVYVQDRQAVHSTGNQLATVEFVSSHASSPKQWAMSFRALTSISANIRLRNPDGTISLEYRDTRSDNISRKCERR